MKLANATANASYLSPISIMAVYFSFLKISENFLKTKLKTSLLSLVFFF